MEILIIGATGFIGAEISAAARAAGHHVTGCARGPWDGKARAAFPVREDYWSLSDGELPDAVLDRTDCMVLLAAIRPYASFGMKDYESNVALAQKYMALAAEHGIRNVVFASSKAVYSGQDRLWKEDAVFSPSSLYGASKAAAEQLGLYYSRTGGIRFKALRLAQVIGLGERKGYLISTLIDNAAAGKTQVVFGQGVQRRQYIYVRDVCRAVLAAADRPDVSGIFNIGMPCSVSNLELAEAANRAFGNDGNLVLDTNRPEGPSDAEMDISAARESLGFEAAYRIDDIFADLAKTAIALK